MLEARIKLGRQPKRGTFPGNIDRKGFCIFPIHFGINDQLVPFVGDYFGFKCLIGVYLNKGAKRSRERFPDALLREQDLTEEHKAQQGKPNPRYVMFLQQDACLFLHVFSLNAKRGMGH